MKSLLISSMKWGHRVTACLIPLYLDVFALTSFREPAGKCVKDFVVSGAILDVVHKSDDSHGGILLLLVAWKFCLLLTFEGLGFGVQQNVVNMTR